MARSQPHYHRLAVHPQPAPRDHLRSWLASHAATIAAVFLAITFVAGGAGPWSEVVRDFLGRTDPFWVREDFTALYAAGALVHGGLASQVYDTHTIAAAEYAAAHRHVGGTGILLYFNPPFFAWLLSPLAHLSLAHAYQLWTVGNLALLALNCWLIAVIARPLPRSWRVLIVLGYLTLYPLTFGLRLGQFSLILQAAWAAGAIALTHDRDRLAGLAFTPLLIKPELALPALLFMALKRRWAAIAIFSAVAAAAVIFSVALIGIPAAIDYPAFLIGSTSQATNGVAPDLMINWSGLLAATGGNGPSVSRPLLAALLSVITLAAAVVYCRPPRERTSVGFALQWLAITLAALLCDPHLYTQDTIIVVPAAVAVLATAPRQYRAPIACALVVSWAVQRLALAPNQEWHINLFALSLAVAFVAIVAPALIPARAALRPRPAPEANEPATP